VAWSPPIATYRRSGTGLVPGSAELFTSGETATRVPAINRIVNVVQKLCLGPSASRSGESNSRNRRREDGVCLIHKEEWCPVSLVS
jgi:hypothetical protein